MSIAPADTTLAAIRRKVRRLTTSTSNNLSDATIDQYINQSYLTDFPYGIKVDQMRSVYTFYTEPYVDQYPLDVNYNQGVRAPFYVDGIPGNFFKDRTQFFNMWPRYPTSSTASPLPQITGSIVNATQTDPVVITSVAHGLVTGQTIFIEGVVGMTELNENSFVIKRTGNNLFELVGTLGSTFSAYVSGGAWLTPQSASFTIAATPFLPGMVTIGGVDEEGHGISICDDSYGILLYTTPNLIDSEPFVPPNPPDNINSIPSANPPIPGMINNNNFNPGLQKTQTIGTVDYVTGEVVYSLPSGVVYADGTDITVRVSQYQTGRPYSLLFWNNQFTIRPIPKKIHKCEIEVYLTPVQFMETTDNPLLTQWWEYIALLASMKILEDRQDVEGRANLMPILMRQEGLVLERQGVEEIGQRNATIYSSAAQNLGWNNGWGSGGYY